MKSFFLASLFFLSLLLSVFGQSPDWKWQNPYPTGNHLSKVYFSSNLTGWLAGSSGTLLKTTDGGHNWKIQSTGTKKMINSIHFLNEQTGWAVGQSGTILRTVNGGRNWFIQMIVTTQHLMNITFSDSQNGWIVGTGNTLLKTTNGGLTWQNQVVAGQNNFSSIDFINTQTGWIVGSNGSIMKTTNGGQIWQSQTSGTPSWLHSVHFVSSQTGWATGKLGKILKTTDGGQNWLSQNSGTTEDLNEVYFNDSLSGWGVGNSGIILKTTNGGMNWQNQTIGNELELTSIHFSGPLTGWAVGRYGAIYKTENGGEFWQILNPGQPGSLKDVHFADGQIGWAVGSNGNILKTVNSGQDWHRQNSGTNTTLVSVHFVNAQCGWAIGGDTLLKTTNGGGTWTSSGIASGLLSVHFVDLMTGWAVGSMGTIMKTTNGGNSWQTQNSGTINLLFSVHFANAQIGWAVGLGGTIRRTTNGGTTWQNQNSGTTLALYSVHFVNTQVGWAVGESGTIVKTTNGGLLWQSQLSGTGNELTSVCFSNSQIGFAAGWYGTILKTVNGGTTWQQQNTNTEQYLNSVFVLNEQAAWAVGEGVILSTLGNILWEDPQPTSLIKGKLFQKTDSNCNNLNIPVPGRIVKATPGPYYGISSQEGDYEIPVIPENSSVSYLVKTTNFSFYNFQITTACPPSGEIVVVADTIPDSFPGNNFGFEYPNCHFLNVHIASDRRRRCFRNSTRISYGNNGFVPALESYIVVEFPRWVKGISATAPYSLVNDSTWRFDLGTVLPQSGGFFTITDSVVCGHPEIFNLMQCTKATIYPAPNCPPPSNWNGSEISLTGQCINGLVDFSLHNLTAYHMPDSVDYWVYLDSIQVKVGKVKLASGDSIHFLVQTAGMTATFTINQVAGNPSSAFLTAVIEDCSNTPFYPRQMANHFPQSQLPNSKMDCLPIRDSFDPNDKQAFPIGFTANHVVKPGTEMVYLIRFQNTGNDTAYTVYVIDSLDKNLNVESLEIGAVSHPYELTLQTTKQGRNYLRFQFNHINLPDSGANELKSHGFIQYRISPKPNLALGSQAKNHAAIYFDFNLPVITNQTLTTFDNLVFTNPLLNDNVQIISSAASQWSRSETIQVFPNPFSHSLSLRSENPEAIRISFCDLMGRELFSKSFSGATELNLSHLPAGVYLLKFPGQNRVMKVVKE